MQVGSCTFDYCGQAPRVAPPGLERIGRQSERGKQRRCRGSRRRNSRPARDSRVERPSLGDDGHSSCRLRSGLHPAESFPSCIERGRACSHRRWQGHIECSHQMASGRRIQPHEEQASRRGSSDSPMSFGWSISLTLPKDSAGPCPKPPTRASLTMRARRSSSVGRAAHL